MKKADTDETDVKYEAIDIGHPVESLEDFTPQQQSIAEPMSMTRVNSVIPPNFSL